MRKTVITAKRLREVVRYDPITGTFVRLQCGQRPDVVGRRTSQNAKGSGYLRVVIDGRRYYCHRLAWMYMTGEWPEIEIDHIDGNKTNNVWSNLRTVTPLLNKQNQRRAYANSQSGILGVSWDTERSKWTARIKVNGVYKFLGRFDEAKNAQRAYVAAKRKHHEGCTI